MRPLIAAAAMALAAVTPAAANTPAPNAHGFTFTAIDGAPMPLAAYKGKVMLVVNTASQCGFTKQYSGLQALHTAYEAKGFTVIGVPSDNFGGQEFADNKKIKDFCSSTFGITFPMAERGDVRGDNALPFYQWARVALGDDKAPRWNFHKYLVGRDGKLIGAFGSRVAPDAPELRAAIDKALAQK
jgi:glutathione peroxidase